VLDTDVGRIDAVRLKVPDRCRAEKILADFGDHVDLSAAQTRRHSLIGAFAAEAEIEPVAKDRLAGFWKFVRERDEIDVGTANDSDTSA